MRAREVMSVDEALFYADAWGAQEDSLGHSDLAFKALAAEVRRLRSPAPVFDMEAAVEAVARKMAINVRHDPDGWGMTVDGVKFKIWEVLRDRAHEMIAIVCQHLQPDMEALRRENDSFRDALESIRQYGSDTLSGRVDGPDDRSWQREGVLEMTKRAQAALAAQAGKQGGG